MPEPADAPGPSGQQVHDPFGRDAHDPHGHGNDWAARAAALDRDAQLHAPVLRAATSWLGDLLAADGRDPDTVRRVVDVGAGPGAVTGLLAEAFPAAEVVAVDPAAPALQLAEARAREHGFADRFRAVLGGLPDGLGEAGPADVVWVRRVLHHVGDQQAGIDALAAAARPGGLVALVEGHPGGRSLPRDLGFGRPGLEARLEAAAEDWFTALRSSVPGARRVVEDWPGMLVGAGLVRPSSRSFLLDVPAPSIAEVRAAVRQRLERAVERDAELLDADDLRTLAVLLDPAAPQGVDRRGDLYLLEITTVHAARAGGAEG